MQTLTATIEELVLPSSIDDPAFADFREMIEVRNAVETDLVGTDLFTRSAEESIANYQDQRYNPVRVFVARVDGRIVGRGLHRWSNDEAPTVAWPSVEVLPEYRGRGIGTALADEVERAAAADGRTTYQTWTPHRTIPGGERVPSPSGFGDLPAADPGVHFLTRRGYKLAQVERISVLDLPVPAERLAHYRAHAEAASAGYRTVSWVGPTPEDRLDDMCWLRNRMSVDIPVGAMEVIEEAWTPERIRAEEVRHVAGGWTTLTAAAEHIESGRLAGYTMLLVPTDRSKAVGQDATLVTSDHRGHRLGMLLKVANIEAVQAFSPESPLIVTGNAEENRYMLSTNEAVGFRALYAEGAWEKKTVA